jgi:pyruvate-ferredoxin/flavodoxin oxidoreductase
VLAHRAARPFARPRSSAAPRRTPTSSSRRARRQPVLRGRARPSCRPRWTSSRKLTGRRYACSTTSGPDAERVVVLMGSGTETVPRPSTPCAPSARRSASPGPPLPAVRRRQHFLAALPTTCAVRSPCSTARRSRARGEPLYQDVRTALSESAPRGAAPAMPQVIGGRYGLSSKEFTPAMVKAVFDELGKATCRRSAGSRSASTTTSPARASTRPGVHHRVRRTVRAVFYGLGSDGTVGANKNTIKIIGSREAGYAQGYFVYDSKKSGSQTVSHLRFGPTRSGRLPDPAGELRRVPPVQLLERTDVLEARRAGRARCCSTRRTARRGLGRPADDGAAADRLQEARLYVIDATRWRGGPGMGGRINTIMQTCFFAISGVLPRERRSRRSRYAIEKTYAARRAEEVVRKNFEAVDLTLANLHEVEVPALVTSRRYRLAAGRPDHGAGLRPRGHGEDDGGPGDELPVSASPSTAPTHRHGAWEKRNISQRSRSGSPTSASSAASAPRLPARRHPREVLRGQAARRRRPTASSARRSSTLAASPRSSATRSRSTPEDCTGCALCVEVCPAQEQEKQD